MGCVVLTAALLPCCAAAVAYACAPEHSVCRAPGPLALRHLLRHRKSALPTRSLHCSLFPPPCCHLWSRCGQ
eukprot:2541264-Rhodomonas_salina.3